MRFSAGALAFCFATSAAFTWVFVGGMSIWNPELAPSNMLRSFSRLSFTIFTANAVMCEGFRVSNFSTYLFLLFTQAALQGSTPRMLTQVSSSRRTCFACLLLLKTKLQMVLLRYAYYRWFNHYACMWNALDSRFIILIYRARKWWDRRLTCHGQISVPR